MRKIKNTLFISLTLVSNLIIGQINLKKGYVLITQTDTLYGEIEVRGESYMAKKCRFFDKKINKLTVYYPQDIVGYFVDNSNLFVSKKIDNQFVFLQYLVKGKLNAYFYNDKKGEHYLIEKYNTGIIELPYKEGVIRDDNKTYNFKSTDHIKLLYNATNDAPIMQNLINQVKKPNHDNLTEIASKYHYEICKDSLCIVYQRNKIKSKPIISINSGVNVYNKNIDEFEGRLASSIGFSIEKPFERINANLSLKTGINFDLINDNYINSIRKIPIQIIYNIPLKSFTPNLGFGFNLLKIKYEDNYFDSYFSFLISPGIIKNITSKFGFSLNYEFEYLPKRYLPIYDKTLSNSLKIGIRYKLGANN